MKATASAAIAIAIAALLLGGCAGLCLDPTSPGVSVLPDGRCGTTFPGLGDVTLPCCVPPPPPPPSNP